MTSLAAVNEFVLRFANVNGTGSASANAMVAKSFYRSGLPIGPKNMFPSNIQGLPTWYEVRVSERGFTGRRGGVDLMVAMNPQTFAKDTKEVLSGGYLIYDSSRFLAPEKRRTDITYLELPITEIARDEFPNPKTRGLLKNMIYVGALAALLDIDMQVFRRLVEEQFAGKEKLHAPNFKALDLGYNYAKKHFSCPCGLKVQPKDLVGDKIILGGNEAAAMGCLYAGATVAAWYPITPSTSLVDAFSKYCHLHRVDREGKHQFAIIQAEDEIASIGMVLGASWNGARSFTATSGPGISLMSEFLGYAYYAELPAVLFNVQRCGPSTGMPTRTQQPDLILCAYASHGDTKHIMLIPSTPKECFEMGYAAFDFADRFQTPVFVMSDLELGMNDYLTDPLEWDDSYQHDRGKVYSAEQLAARTEKFQRYLDIDGDGVPWRTLPGVHANGSYFTRGSGHDRFGRYTEDGELYCDNLDRIVKKFQLAAEKLPQPEFIADPQANKETLVVCFGTTWEPLQEAVCTLAEQGVHFDVLRLRSFPFGTKVKEHITNYRRLVVVEQNRDAQMRQLLIKELELNPANIASVLHYNGLPITATFLIEALRGELA